MSLFTATIINAIQTAVDGTKCADIEDKEVSVNYSTSIIDCAMRIKYRKESVQITFFFVSWAKQIANIKRLSVDLCSECSVFIMSNFYANCRI